MVFLKDVVSVTSKGRQISTAAMKARKTVKPLGEKCALRIVECHLNGLREVKVAVRHAKVQSCRGSVDLLPVFVDAQ